MLDDRIHPKQRLIVLDDEPDICALIEDIGLQAGWDVMSITDFAQFSEQLNIFLPDLILLDLSMPGTDGVEVLRYLANHDSAAKVVLMSGQDSRVLRAAERLGGELGLAMAGIFDTPIAVGALRDYLATVKPRSDKVDAAALAAALDLDQLCVHYQPKVGLVPPNDATATVLRTQRGVWPLAGVEALVRWNHPELGLVPPIRFVPLAEATGLIGRLTRFVVSVAFAQAAAWRRAGLVVPVAVNVAPHLLADLDLPDRFEAQAREAGIAPGQVTLEVTETAAMRDIAQTMDILTRLRLKGFALSMDDFGTGYSSLVHLYRLPFSEVKIDRSFVSEIGLDPEADVVVQTVIDMARNMKLSVCAEGVETEAAQDFLRQAGCDAAQGFLFQRPVPADALTELLAEP